MTRALALVLLAGTRCLTAGVTSDLARQFEQITLDTDECYRVTELNISKEDIKVYLASGYLIFSKPIAGFRQAAVFVASADAGDAEVLIMPPSRSERMSLATFTQSPNLDEHLKAAAFLFTDGTAAELLKRIDSATPKKVPEIGMAIAGQWNQVLRSLAATFETRLVRDAMSSSHQTGLFYMAVSGRQFANFDVVYDSRDREQVFVGALGYQNNRAYLDTWTNFPSRSVRNGAPSTRGPELLDDFRIDATIDSDLTMKAVTRMRLTVRQSDSAPLLFSISPNMRVTGASVDGQPAEVFTPESVRSNLIAGGEDHDFLLLPAQPLDASKPHEVEVRHEGSVIRKAGEGVYYVNSRGTWYPHAGTEFANYDLTFRYPKNLTLASTGASVEERTEGEWKISRRRTEGPIRFAGFNLGDFQSSSTDRNGFHIDVYANRHMETALQPKTAPVTPHPTVMPRSRRDAIDMAPSSPPLPPDPAGRFSDIEKNVDDALDFMTAAFGPPATHNLSITPIPASFGQGFPGLIYLSTVAYLNADQRPLRLHASYEQTFYSDLLEPHEVAHQWWGNLVTPANYRDEWLIESLANYSALLLLEKKKGAKALNELLDDYRNHLLQKTETGRTLESVGPISWGRRLESSHAPNAWEVVAYQKGTWVIHMLRRQIGDANFYKLLREVASKYRLRPISTDQFRELAQTYMPPHSKDPSLKNFFENWVDGTGIPTVKLTYAWRAGKLTGTLSQSNVGDDFSALVPVEVQSAKQRTVYWLPIASDPIPFSIPMPVAPARTGLLASDGLLISAR